MKKKLILTGIIFLCLVGLIIVFVVLAKRYSPLISSNQQTEQSDKANIDLIGKMDVDGQKFDVKINAVKNNTVVAENGLPVRNDLEPKSSNSPIVSLNINEADVSLPENIIKVVVDQKSINPNPIVVLAGQPTTLMVESADEWYHILRFVDPNLKAVAVGVAGGEARLVRFNAPTTTGDYVVYDDIFGVAGKMIVQ